MNAVTIDVDMLASLPTKTLLSLLEKRKVVKRFFDQSMRALQQHTSLFLTLEEMNIDVGFDPDYQLISVRFTGDGSKLGKVWGELRRHGWNCDARPKKGDTEFHGWFSQEGEVKISVSFTSSLCRRVQVGTKTVEQPIYETICGDVLHEIDEPVPEALPPPEAPQAVVEDILL